MSVNLLYLSLEDVLSLGGADMVAAIDDVSAANSLYEQGDVIIPHKIVMRWGKTKDDELDSGRINGMPAYLGGQYDMAGIKWIGSNPKNPGESNLPRASALIILNDPKTKLPLAVMDGTVISAMRTGAAHAVAARYLARRDSRKIILIGAGVQNRTQLMGLQCVLPELEKVLVNDIDFPRAELFAQEMSRQLGLNIEPVRSVEHQIHDADVIVTATVTREPIVQAEWLHPGCLYSNVSGYECTFDALRKADKIVVDNWQENYHRQSSTVSRMVAAGLLDESEIHAELGQIVNGKKSGREREEEVIYFNSVGMGILDIAIATRIYRNALRQQTGIHLPLWQNPFSI